jgi:hypothetical protein
MNVRNNAALYIIAVPGVQISKSFNPLCSGADIKVMETEAFRQQKAEQQQAADGHQQPQQQPFMNFSPEEAAAARNAAAQDAAQRKGTAGGHPSPSPGAPIPPSDVSMPTPALTHHEAASAAIDKVRHQIDDLAKQVRRHMQLKSCDRNSKLLECWDEA